MSSMLLTLLIPLATQHVIALLWLKTSFARSVISSFDYQAAVKESVDHSRPMRALQLAHKWGWKAQ